MRLVFVRKAVASNKEEFIPEGTRFNPPSMGARLHHPQFSPAFHTEDGLPNIVHYALHPSETVGKIHFETRRGHSVWYDPEVARRIQPDDPYSYAPQTELMEGTGYTQDFPEEEGEAGHLYRGMSHDEFHNALRDGYFQSDGRLNLTGEEGHTLFARRPDTARVYATGFAPEVHQPTFGKSGYIIKIKEPDDVEHYDYTNNYKGVKGRIPISSMVSAWEARPHTIHPDTGNLRLVSETGYPLQYEQGSNSGSHRSYGFKKVF